MPLLKVDSILLNTEQIAAVELERISITGQSFVVVQMVTRGLFNWKLKEFWFEGEAARALRFYFSAPENVTVLLSSQLRCSNRRSELPRRKPLRFNPPPRSSTDDDAPAVEPPLPEEAWGNSRNDLDEPPPPPTICRRPWGPQSPSPLSAATFPEEPEPPIP